MIRHKEKRLHVVLGYGPQLFSFDCPVNICDFDTFRNQNLLLAADQTPHPVDVDYSRGTMLI